MGISAAARKHLESEIAMIMSRLTHIDDEIDSLVGKREAEQAKLDSLLALVGKTADEIEPGFRTNSNPDREKDLEDIEIAGMTFRDVIRSILRASGDYLTVREIAEDLALVGFDYKGSTEITTRLGNDLSRMVRQGNVLKGTKRIDGRQYVVYKLKPEES